MVDLREVSREPAAVAEALRTGEREVLEVWDALASGEVDAVLVGRVTGGSTGAPVPRCLLPGSFNPVHQGHRGMLATAARAGTDAGGAYELAILNPDKPPLSPGDAAQRLSRFFAGESVWLTRAPTFPEKARIFPGATFVVGVDTIVRIADPRYYAGVEGLRKAISVLGACRFLVFGRRAGGGFETLESISLPGPLRALCVGVPESDFRADISSTELRRSAGEDAG